MWYADFLITVVFSVPKKLLEICEEHSQKFSTCIDSLNQVSNQVKAKKLTFMVTP